MPLVNELIDVSGGGRTATVRANYVHLRQASSPTYQAHRLKALFAALDKAGK